jgi:hypothetical protein
MFESFLRKHKQPAFCINENIELSWELLDSCDPIKVNFCFISKMNRWQSASVFLYCKTTISKLELSPNTFSCEELKGSIQSCHLRFRFTINNKRRLIVKNELNFLKSFRFAIDLDLK